MGNRKASGWETAYLAALRSGSTMATAAREAKVHPSTPYARRKYDTRFAESVENARAAGGAKPRPRRSAEANPHWQADFLEALAETLQRFDHNARHPLGDDEPLLDLLAQGTTVPYLSFESDAAVTRAQTAVQDLLTWVQALDPASDSETHDPSHPFQGGPRPRAELGLRPRM